MKAFLNCRRMLDRFENPFKTYCKCEQESEFIRAERVKSQAKILERDINLRDVHAQSDQIQLQTAESKNAILNDSDGFSSKTPVLYF